MLCAWIGTADLEAKGKQSDGPILGALRARKFDEVWLLCSWPEERVLEYVSWLSRSISGVRIQRRPASLSQPNAFSEIYEHASKTVAEAVETAARPPQLTFHLSPGTPIMASVWLLLATSRFPAELIESSAGRVNTVEKPFNLPAQVLPDMLRDPDRRLEVANAERPATTGGFERIMGESEAMRRVLTFAKKAAPRNVPLLIEGESGTGKELFAQAIHQASPRAANPIVVVNCGAIPSNLVESELFGHKQGSFTGAEKDRAGYFEAASGGTLFLDEIGELPLSAQVALLRVLQEKEVTRVGESKPRKVDVRVISATNRDLFVETQRGRFREDLFYRLAVLRIKLPPLRDRRDDLDLLIDSSLALINEEMKDDPLFRPKSLSDAARAAMFMHPWRGNVRELQNTLRRALVWSEDDVISGDDLRTALLPVSDITSEGVLDRSLTIGFNLDAVLSEVSSHYITRALVAAKGNKSRAAKLIGFASYQRLDQQCHKLGIVTTPEG